LLRSSPSEISPQVMRQGYELFTHSWTEHDPLAGGDGLGPVYNATSCVECHNQRGAGGGGPSEKNVTVYSLAKPHPKGLPQSGVVHRSAVKSAFQETLRQIHPSLPDRPVMGQPEMMGGSGRRPPEVSITQRNTPALFGDGKIDAISADDVVNGERKRIAARLVSVSAAHDSQVRGHVARLADGRIGRFGWKLEFATLGDFVKAACANELGLSNPNRPQATPMGRTDYRGQGIDLTEAQCGLMTDFIRGLPSPREAIPEDPQLAKQARTGKTLFRSVGCADCHTESLGTVMGLYSDLLLHDMGTELEATAGYRGHPAAQPAPSENSEDKQQPSPGEWRTAPLWGVADSAPYLHDGRAATLERAIEMHGGEAAGAVGRFRSLSPDDRQALIAFLNTLRAPLIEPEPPHWSKLAAR
jgi:CxxC motif-containing protein (DUF1111 family)